MARAQSISLVLLGHWQRSALEAAVPSSAEHDKIQQSRAALKRVEMERDMLKKVVTSCLPQAQALPTAPVTLVSRSRIGSFF